MSDEVTALLEDPIIVKVVRFIGRASLSILELLEFGITQKEINHALANEVLVFDKPKRQLMERSYPVGGDYYFEFLNSKVKLSELGLLILQHEVVR